jgi:hypothetical protein
VDSSVLLETENVNEIQRCLINKSRTQPPTCGRAAWLCDKFGAGGMVQNVDKKCSENLAVQ